MKPIGHFAALAVLAAAPIGSATPSPACTVVSCSGCAGSGHVTVTTTVGTKSVTVDLTVSNGACVPGQLIGCVAAACEFNVTFSWSGLTQGDKMKLCEYTHGGRNKCIDPAPIVDSTGVGSNQDSGNIVCGGAVDFSTTDENTGLTTGSVTGTCSACTP